MAAQLDIIAEVYVLNQLYECPLDMLPKMDVSLPHLNSASSGTTTLVPKDQVRVLSQEISSELGIYRVLAGGRVRYITMPADTFDEDTMGIPYLFIPALPDLPSGDWVRMSVEKDGQKFRTVTSNDPLDGIESVWHRELIDVLTLPKDKVLNKCTYETTYQGKPAIMKIANFEYDVPQVENETSAYSMVGAYERNHPDEPPLTPKFLGHLAEHGRVIGFLLEKREGRFASIDDIPVCRALVTQFHKAGLIHGDVNRYNFIINDQEPTQSCMIDLEHWEPFDEGKAILELESLTSELTEETGRGLALM